MRDAQKVNSADQRDAGEKPEVQGDNKVDNLKEAKKLTLQNVLRHLKFTKLDFVLETAIDVICKSKHFHKVFYY